MMLLVKKNCKKRRFPIVQNAGNTHLCPAKQPRTRTMNRILLISLVLFLIPAINKFEAKAQISVPSSNGYTVNIIVKPKSIVPSTNNCQWGYNYNVNIDYFITFTGSNIPASVYNLHGNIGCDTKSHFFMLPRNASAGNLTSTSNQWRSQNDCATATVNSLSCNQASITISGPGIPNRTVTFPVTYSLLPVELVEFSADALKDKVKLQWATVTEINNDYFTIERSADGSNWKEIKQVKGAGNTTDRIDYNSYDENPVNGTNYYRIKQTDFDGKFIYSEIRQVKFTGSTVISVYPNPNDGNTISFKGISRPADMVMTVRDAAGSSVYSSTLSSNNAQLPVLKAGIYVISLVNKANGEVNNLRYVKM